MQPSTSQSHGREIPALAVQTATLHNGKHVLIRPMRREDAPAEREFIQSLSPESRRNRFLCQIRVPSDALVKSLTDIDQVGDVALAAVADEAGSERIVGVSRYSTDPDGAACEAAVTVLDDWQGQGLGTRLMRQLIDVARERGIKRMLSRDVAENARMKSFAKFLGFDARQDPEDPRMVVHTLTLD